MTGKDTITMRNSMRLAALALATTAFTYAAVPAFAGVED